MAVRTRDLTGWGDVEARLTDGVPEQLSVVLLGVEDGERRLLPYEEAELVELSGLTGAWVNELEFEIIQWDRDGTGTDVIGFRWEFRGGRPQE